MQTYLFISLVIFLFRHSVFFLLSITETLVCILNNIESTLTKIRCLLRVICYKTCLSSFFFFFTVQWIDDQRRSSSMIISFWHIQRRMKENISFTSLSLSFFFLRLHLRRGNQIEYIYRERKREEMDACRAFATAEMR